MRFSMKSTVMASAGARWRLNGGDRLELLGLLVVGAVAQGLHVEGRDDRLAVLDQRHAGAVEDAAQGAGMITTRVLF